MTFIALRKLRLRSTPPNHLFPLFAIAILFLAGQVTAAAEQAAPVETTGADDGAADCPRGP